MSSVMLKKRDIALFIMLIVFSRFLIPYLSLMHLLILVFLFAAVLACISYIMKYRKFELVKGVIVQYDWLEKMDGDEPKRGFTITAKFVYNGLEKIISDEVYNLERPSNGENIDVYIYNKNPHYAALEKKDVRRYAIMLAIATFLLVCRLYGAFK